MVTDTRISTVKNIFDLPENVVSQEVADYSAKAGGALLESKAEELFSYPTATYKVADYFGNPNPRPPERYIFDSSLQGTGKLAYYVNPKEVTAFLKFIYPGNDTEIESAIQRELGPNVIVAYNPDVLKLPVHVLKSVKNHEDAHGGQPGKLLAKAIGILTPYGALPIGEMIVEGGNEYALEATDMKPPSRYFDDNALYSFYRRFVEELEYQMPGVTRDFLHATAEYDIRRATKVLDSVSGIDRLIGKYAWAFANRN